MVVLVKRISYVPIYNKVAADGVCPERGNDSQVNPRVYDNGVILG